MRPQPSGGKEKLLILVQFVVKWYLVVETSNNFSFLYTFSGFPLGLIADSKGVVLEVYFVIGRYV
jgi:hypothetical protein